MDLDKIFESKIFKFTIIGIVFVIFFLFAFLIGMQVGFQKANFAYKWGENYHKNFAGPRDGFFREFDPKDLPERDFMDSHGAFGKILKISESNIIMNGQDNIEKNILVNSDTSIIKFKEKIKIVDLKTDDYIVVLGDANDSGQIEAKLIRIMPTPPKNN